MSANITPMIIALTVGTVAVLVAMVKSGHFIRYMVLSLISGIGSLFAVNLLSALTGVSISLNYITLSVSSLFGIPGVIALLLAF